MSEEEQAAEADENMLAVDDVDAPSAMELDLDDDQIKVAARVMNILDEKNEDGSFVYTNLEVRDFVCACIFELGIPITAEIQVALYSFLDDVPVEEDPTPEQLLTGVRAYFEENPLNEKLAEAFEKLGRDELQREGEGFKNDKAKQNAAFAAAGVSKESRAPQAEEKKGEKPKVKKGLT
jgi:hypothetical protein